MNECDYLGEYWKLDNIWDITEHLEHIFSSAMPLAVDEMAAEIRRYLARAYM